MAGRSSGGYTRVSYPTCVALSGSYQLRYLSLFSGVEAASLAWEPMGWKPIAFSEIEKFPRAVLQHHFPNVTLHGDMTQVDWSQYHGQADVLVAGAPCQAFSVAGLRNSLSDDRGNLTLATIGALNAVRPRYFVFENVPGILNTKDNAFGCFLAGVVGADTALIPTTKRGRWTNAGVVVGPERTAAWRILDAQHFGVPQRRKRVFLVACPRDGANPAEILFESHSLQGHPAPSREAREDLAADAGSSPTYSLTKRYDSSEDGTGRGVPLVPHLAPTVSAGPPFSRTGNERVEAQELVPMHGLTGPLSARDYKDLGTDGINSDSAKMVPIWRGSDQANAETVEGQAGTLNCNKGQQGDNAALPCGEVVGTVTARKGRNNGIANDDVQAGHLICVNARETPVSESGKSLPLGAQDRGHAIGFIPKNSEKTRSMGEQAEMSPTLGLISSRRSICSEHAR
jgi:DNA-cytosine methyltransferase